MVETADAGVVSPKAWQQLPAEFEWGDLVLPSNEDEQLRAVAAEFDARFREAAGAPRIRARGQRMGILVLLCGPAGTGKTMAAQTLAHELRLGVVEANLNSVLVRDRWRMSRLFAVAARSGAVLAFDHLESMTREAEDAAGSGLREGADDLSDLLERSSSHPGVVIFATRQRLAAELVSGRFDHVIQFPLPGRAAREELWRRHLAETGLGEPDISLLADAVDLTGGEIAACCAAAKQSCAREGIPVQIDHVVRALERNCASRSVTHRGNEGFELLRTRIKPETSQRADADRAEPPASAQAAVSDAGTTAARPAMTSPTPPPLPVPADAAEPTIGRRSTRRSRLADDLTGQDAPARDTHALSWVIAGVSGIVVAVALGLALAGSRGASALPVLDRQTAAGPVLVSYPSGWQTPVAPSVPRAGLIHAVALAPADSAHHALVVGTTGAAGASLLPPGFVASLASSVVGQRVKLGSLWFYRFPDLTLRGEPRRETVYVLPTTAGLVMSECLNPGDGFTGTCERILKAMKMRPGVQALATNPDYPRRLSEIIATLNLARTQAYSRLAAAKTAGDQASVESRLAQANTQAGSAIASLDAGPVRVANAALAAGLKSTGGAYAGMARAASQDDAASYRAASSSLDAATRATGAAFADLKRLGYVAG